MSEYRSNRAHFKADTCYGLLRAAAVVALVFSMPTIGNALFKHLYIDITRVSVSDTKIDGNPVVIVYRNIKSDFSGKYSIEIRHADSGFYVCQSDFIETLNYKAKANATQPLVTNMEDWMASPEDWQDCKNDSRWTEGTYIATTTHYTNFLQFFAVSRSIESNVFNVSK